MALSGRLPTDEDWRQMAALYGGAAARRTLLTGSTSGFDALLGGGRDLNGQFARLEPHGFYWAATEDGPASAVYHNCGQGKLSLFRQSEGEKPRAFSVRCVAERGARHSPLGYGAQFPTAADGRAYREVVCHLSV